MASGAKRVLMTLPGRLGDNLFRLPIAYQYSLEHHHPVDICVDHSSSCMLPLLHEQPWVRTAFFEPGVTNYDNGGQPWNFVDPHTLEQWPQVYHLGYRNPPDGNLTLSAYRQSGVPLPPEREGRLLHASCLRCDRGHLPIRAPVDLCIHVSAASAHTHSQENTNRRNHQTLATLLPIIDRLSDKFNRIWLVGKGHTDQTRHLMGLGHPKIRYFDDHGNLSITLNQLCKSVLVGTYSSMWALATVANLPQVVVMDRQHYRPDRIANDACRIVFPDNSEGLFHAIMHQWMNWDRFVH